MKKILLSVFLLFAATVVSAQNPTAYFMEGSTIRSQLNPAFAPLRGYVNVPILGGVDFNVSGNMSLDKVLFPINGKLVTLLDSSVSSQMALDGLSPNNLLGLDSRINIIGFGAFRRDHKTFWSVDLNLRTNMGANLPYELFDFLKRGQAANITGIGAYGDAFIEAGFNYSFPVMRDKMYIGVRGKVLLGAARARMRFDRFDVTMDEDLWRVDAAGVLDISASGLDIASRMNDQGQEVYDTDDMSMGFGAPAGYGLAFDLGMTYNILPNLQASLAVNDIGFICWGQKYNNQGVVNKVITFEGITINAADGSTQPNFDIGDIEFEKTKSKGATKMIRASINAGLEYNIWRHKIGIGVLYTARIWQYETLHNITGSINFHPVRWFTVTGSYSVIDNRGGAVGLALNLNTNWINFYLATDMLTVKHTPQFIPIKQSMMNVTLGLGVPIGKRSYRIAEYRNRYDIR